MPRATNFWQSMDLAEDLECRQTDVRAKMHLLKGVLETEKTRLLVQKNHLEAEKQQWMNYMQALYAPPPCTCEGKPFCEAVMNQFNRQQQLLQSKEPEEGERKSKSRKSKKESESARQSEVEKPSESKRGSKRASESARNSEARRSSENKMFPGIGIPTEVTCEEIEEEEETSSSSSSDSSTGCLCMKDLQLDPDGDYTACLQQKKDFETDDDKCLKEFEDDETVEEEECEDNIVLIQCEKQLGEDMLLKMQLKASGRPKNVCECKERNPNGVIQPFSPSPHSHTTFFKTELLICDVRANNDVKTSCKLRRIDKIKEEEEGMFRGDM